MVVKKTHAPTIGSAFVLIVFVLNQGVTQGLSIGFGKIFLEFNPVDIRAVFPWIPAVTAGEEQVLLVRRDHCAMFKIGRVDSRAQISMFGPGAIRQTQG